MFLDFGIEFFLVIFHEENFGAEACEIIGTKGLQVHAFAVDRHQIDSLVWREVVGKNLGQRFAANACNGRF